MFATRVRVYGMLDTFVEWSGYGLEKVRGLGIESPFVKWVAGAAVLAGLVKMPISPHAETQQVASQTLCRLAFAVFAPESSGWTRFGETWVCIGQLPDGRSRPDPESVYAVGGDAAVWREVRDAFVSRYPAALLSDSRDGLRVTADRPTNTRPRTSAELELATRVRKYVDVGVSVLLHGPQGSAKTTAACSIAMDCVGSYFRLSASRVCQDVIDALVDLQPRAVVIDDIDRVDDVALLDLLDALTGIGVLTFGTSNTAPDDMDAALVRTGRFDIHRRVDHLDPESHAQICSEQGIAGIDLGSRGPDLLASDLVALGRAHAAGDLPDPAAAAEDLVARRTNTRRVLRAVPTRPAEATR